MEATSPVLCIGGMPAGLFPMDQGTRFFSGEIQQVRLSRQTSPFRNEPSVQAGSARPSVDIAFFLLKDASRGVIVDITPNRWRAQMVLESAN